MAMKLNKSTLYFFIGYHPRRRFWQIPATVYKAAWSPDFKHSVVLMGNSLKSFNSPAYWRHGSKSPQRPRNSGAYLELEEWSAPDLEILWAIRS